MSVKRPLFSILTPVYNGAPTLQAAADTLRRQTFRDFEWIIVDDGSTDGTAEIIDRFASGSAADDARSDGADVRCADMPVRAIHQPNGGVSVARNHAMDEAKGEWIVWLDADDAFTPDALEYIAALVSAHPETEALHFPYREITSTLNSQLSTLNSQPSTLNSQPSTLTPVSGAEAFRRLYVDPATRGQHWQPWRFVYRRDRLPRFRKGVIHEDVDVLPVHLRSLSQVIVSDRPFYLYTPAREGAATQFFNPRRVRDILGVTERNWSCEELRPMLVWNLWGYYRATEKFADPDRSELMARFREHPEYLGMSASELGRHPGLDVARILAMFLVVLQHVVFLGGLANDGMSGFHRIQARLLESFGQCCIDVFGLLSGFLLVSGAGGGEQPMFFRIFNRRRWRKFGALWFQVFTTGLLVLTGCFLLAKIPSFFGLRSPLGVPPSSGDWLCAALPLCLDEYWYFTGYLFVFLLSPLLVSLARLPQAKWLAMASFAAVCGTVAFPGGDAALDGVLKGGYSSCWLVLLAFWGAVLGNETGGRRTAPGIKACGLLFLLMIVATAAQQFLMATIPSLKEFFHDEWTLHHYTSPTIVLASAALLLACSRLDFGRRVRKLIYAVAPCAFGVYLLHVQPFFFANCFKGHFAFLDSLPDWLFGLAALAAAGVILLCCIVLEKLRRRLFSLLHLDF